MNRRTQIMSSLKTKVTHCTRCELSKTRTNAVVGSGSYTADIMFVGEAPGRHEDQTGVPFVGAAGKKLDAALEMAGISREQVYITNVVKCRPPNNMTPLEHHRESCMDYLVDEIKIIKPAIICVMGNTAFGSLLGGTQIIKNRGKVYRKDGNLYFACLHPAAIIYNQNLIKTFQKDIKNLVRIAQDIRDGKDIKTST